MKSSNLKTHTHRNSLNTFLIKIAPLFTISEEVVYFKKKVRSLQVVGCCYIKSKGKFVDKGILGGGWGS